MVHSTDPINLAIDVPKMNSASSAGGGWTLQADNVENFAWWNGAFTPEELDAIINIGNSTELERGRTAKGSDDAVRSSFVSFLFPNEFTSWIFQRLAGVIVEANQRFFGFDLTAMEQGLQFTKYSAPGEHYDWHIDRGMNLGVRKLSLSVQLSAPDDYEGGDLEMWFGGEHIPANRERGMITLFPSYAMHRVTPVTKGTRYSLVVWVSGPPFK